MEFVAGGIAILLAAVAGVVSFRKHTANRHAEEQARQEHDAQVAKEDAEARAAPPLVSLDHAADVNALADQITSLLTEFDTLKTFSDVNSWDHRAEQTATAIDEMGKVLGAFIESAQSDIAVYRKTGAEPHHIKVGRVEKTTKILHQHQSLIRDLSKAYDLLLERIEMTPNNKKDQAALLRELRADKKDLQARKKEAKAGAASLRREARQLSAQAGSSEIFGWPIYNSRSAAIERRAIRRAKEEALAPHEDAVSALDRQIAAVDQRISWVQRFGEADET